MSDTNIVPMNPFLNPDDVLEAAKGGYKNVLVLGWDEQGHLNFHMNEKMGNIKELTWLMTYFKQGLMTGNYNW